MKSTKRHFKLEENEYLVTPDSPDSKDYKVFYKDQDITGEIVALIRYSFKFENGKEVSNT